MLPGCEYLSIIEIGTIEENWWTPIQKVSLSPVFEQIGTTGEHLSSEWATFQSLSRWATLIRMGEHSSSKWVSLQCLSRSEPLTRMDEHPSSKWVTLQCLSKSEPLTRTGEHPSREWVTLQCLSRSEPLTRMGECPSSLCIRKSQIFLRPLFGLINVWRLTLILKCLLPSDICPFCLTFVYSKKLAIL